MDGDVEDCDIFALINEECELNDEWEKERERIECIKTMDFDWYDVKVLNCSSFTELNNKIKENEVLEVEIANQMYYINSSYVMYYKA